MSQQQPQQRALLKLVQRMRSRSDWLRMAECFKSCAPAVFTASDGCRIVYQFSPGRKTPIVLLGGGIGGRKSACEAFGAEAPTLREHAILIFDRRGAALGASVYS